MSVIVGNFLCIIGIIFCELPISLLQKISIPICIVMCLAQMLIYIKLYNNRSGEYIRNKEVFYLVSNAFFVIIVRIVLNLIYNYIHIGDNYGIFFSTVFFIIYNLTHWILLGVYLLIRHMHKKP